VEGAPPSLLKVARELAFAQTKKSSSRNTMANHRVAPKILSLE